MEIETRDGHRGLGFSYSKRAGGPGQFTHAKEVVPALIGENQNDISWLWTQLIYATVPTLDVVFDGLADYIERHFEPGVLQSLITTA